MKKATLISFSLIFVITLARAQDNSQIALDDLQRSTQAKVSLNKNLGTPSFIKFPANKPLTLNGNSLKEKVNNFLLRNKAIYGIEKIDESFDSGTVNTDNYGLKHFVLKQYYNGVPVYDSELRFHFGVDENLKSINGNFLPSINVNSKPEITKNQANTIALNLIKDQNINISGSPLKVINNELYIFPKGLAQGKKVTNYLAYKVEVRNDIDVREYVFVNAITGEPIEQFTGMSHAINRSLYEGDLSNKIYSEGDSTVGLTQWQLNEVETAKHVYNLFKNAFNYISFDNADAEMITINNNPTINCPNANWNGVTTNYCDGMATDDVVAHEWGHAYTEYTCGLIYAYEPGAINEAISDIWGETVDLLNNYQDEGENGDDRTACNSSDKWMIGEDITAPGSASPLRDMWNPTCFGSPGKVSDPIYFCDPNFIDYGGVHYNSGIVNHAYALIVDGGTYNGQTISAIGLTKAAHIIWRAQSLYLTSTSSFSQFADAVEAACIDLIGVNLSGLSTSDIPVGPSGEIITDDDYNQVVKALLAVELREETGCNYGTILTPPIAPLCDAAFDNAIYYQDWENGIPNGWTVSQIPVNPETWEARDWAIETILPKGRPGKAVFGPTPGIGDCNINFQSGIIRLESPSFKMPNYEYGDFEMAFLHSVSTEPEYDGGNLKYSIDGGSWKPIPIYAFTENPYNSIISIKDSDNPLKGEYAFSGVDQGSFDYSTWGVTVINLSILGLAPNSSIKFRWEVGTDGCYGLTGWFVDDIVIFNCSEASLAVNELDFISKNVSIYPNPSTGVFNIKMKGIVDYNLDIYDLTGKVIYSKININENDSKIDLSNYAKGLYLIKITSMTGSVTKKLLLK